MKLPQSQLKRNVNANAPENRAAAEAKKKCQKRIAKSVITYIKQSAQNRGDDDPGGVCWASGVRHPSSWHVVEPHQP
jgi:hypothetical protein